ncbi:MAG: hypothetical protein ACQETL_11865 [Bacteroidota bacterium]
MRKTLKYGLLIFGIVTIFLLGFIGLGFYAMEIEDHYGNLQELYYESKDGDIIVNKTTLEIGKIEKSWKRINIRTEKKDSTGLYNWIYQNGYETKTEVYRPKRGEIELTGVSYSALKKMIDNSQLKLIAKH